MGCKRLKSIYKLSGATIKAENLEEENITQYNTIILVFPPCEGTTELKY